MTRRPPLEVSVAPCEPDLAGQDLHTFMATHQHQLPMTEAYHPDFLANP